jgi:hypothetical protein
MKTDNIANWLVNGEIGTSSKFMAAVYLASRADLLGLKIQQSAQHCHPRDPSDLNRCRLLLIVAPEVRDCFGALRTLNDKWAFVVDNWDYMVSLVESDLEAGKHSSPELYAFMKSGGL